MSLFEKKESTLRLLSEEDAPLAMREAYNRIRINLLARVGTGAPQSEQTACPVIGVTAAVSRAGNRYLAANLAISLAQLGRRILLVDADYRAEETLDALLGVTSEGGLAACVAGRAAAPVAVGDGTLAFLSRGEIAGNPADLVGSAAFRSAVHALREKYDAVLVLLPAVTAYADAATAAPTLSGVVLGTVPGKDKRRDVAAAIETLQTVGLTLYGMIACEE